MLNRELQEQFVKDYPYMTKEELMDKYKIPCHEYRYYKKKLGLKTKDHRISLEKIEYIKYNRTMENTKLSELLDISTTTIWSIKKRLTKNIKTNKK